MKKKFLLCLIGVLMLAMGLTACSSDDDDTPQAGDGNITSDVSGTLTVWARGWANWGLTGGSPDQPYFEYFQEQFPNLILHESVNRDWHYLPAHIAAGDPPDVFFWEGTPPNFFREMVAQGFSEPLDRFIDADLEFRDQFLPGLLEMHRYDGNIYGLPIDVMPVAVVANLDIFDTRNVPHPSIDWTIDDLVSLAGRLTNKADPTSPTVGIVRNIEEQDYIRMLSFFLAAHGVTGYERIDGVRISNLAETPAAITAIQQYLEVQGNNFANTFSHEERVALGLDTGIWNVDWPAGVGALFVGAGPWGVYVDATSQQPLFNQIVLPPPQGPGGSGNVTAIIGISMFAGSDNQELAWEYMRAMACRNFREGAWVTNDAGERTYPLRFDENSYRFGFGIPAFEIDESRLVGQFRDWYLGFKAAAATSTPIALHAQSILEVTRDVENGVRQLVDALREYDAYVNANGHILD
ncbi:MAG: extracellular solute-binding protein [Defluviitaleaceae bacterium]|nr:extracellular solute-binding protein [Defluviitaleaceae bacterium]